MNNRLANAQNQFQGKRKRVLCVCSAGLLRSPTIAWVLSNEPYGFNVRAAGVATEYALVPVDNVLLDWADEIVCAEEDHAVQVRAMLEKFGGASQLIDTPVHVLSVPDRYKFRDPELVELVEQAVKLLKFDEPR